MTKELKGLKSCRVLDAGTGAGNMTKVLSDNLKASIVSVDLNKQVFPYVYEKVDRRKVGFVSCDLANLPFREATFCCIVCDLVISTSENLQHRKTLKEFRRTLAKTSALYVTDYYPEEAPIDVQDKLAAETSRLYREVSEAKRGPIGQGFPPSLVAKLLIEAGYQSVRIDRIRANEPLEWKKRVFKEYYRNMKREISDVEDMKLQTVFKRKLESLKRKIEAGGTMNWNWGVNYIIKAST